VCSDVPLSGNGFFTFFVFVMVKRSTILASSSGFWGEVNCQYDCYWLQEKSYDISMLLVFFTGKFDQNL
jgi:hypothetical protein